MRFTFYGHSCFSIFIEDKHLLFDPFLIPNPDKETLVKELKPDYILVSHGHEDHTANLIEIAKNSNATVIACFEVAEWCTKQGIEKTIGMNTGGQKQFDFGEVKFVNAIHSSVLPDGAYGSNPVGFLIKTDDKNIYYSGDTALTMDMKLIPMWAKVDFCILPIGDTFTMGLQDAFTASDFVECPNIIGVHYNTFPPIKIDTLAAKESASFQNKNLILLDINESIDL